MALLIRTLGTPDGIRVFQTNLNFVDGQLLAKSKRLLQEKGPDSS